MPSISKSASVKVEADWGSKRSLSEFSNDDQGFYDDERYNEPHQVIKRQRSELVEMSRGRAHGAAKAEKLLYLQGILEHRENYREHFSGKKGKPKQPAAVIIHMWEFAHAFVRAYDNRLTSTVMVCPSCSSCTFFILPCSI